MNLVDLILLLVILLATYSGYRKGFILGAIDLLILAAGLVFSFWASGYVVAIYERYVGPAGLWTLPLAFIACFAIARMLIWSIAMKGLTQLPHSVHLSFTNRLLGTVPGMINGLIYVAVLGSLLLAMPLSDGIAAKARESSVATAASPYVQWVGDKLAPVFEDAVNRSITTLTVEPEASKSIALDFTLTNYKIREDLRPLGIYALFKCVESIRRHWSGAKLFSYCRHSFAELNSSISTYGNVHVIAFS